MCLSSLSFSDDVCHICGHDRPLTQEEEEKEEKKANAVAPPPPLLSFASLNESVAHSQNTRMQRIGRGRGEGGRGGGGGGGGEEEELPPGRPSVGDVREQRPWNVPRTFLTDFPHGRASPTDVSHSDSSLVGRQRRHVLSPSIHSPHSTHSPHSPHMSSVPLPTTNSSTCMPLAPPSSRESIRESLSGEVSVALAEQESTEGDGNAGREDGGNIHSYTYTHTHICTERERESDYTHTQVKETESLRLRWRARRSR